MVNDPPTVSPRDIIDRAGGPTATANAISPFEKDAGRPAVEANQVKRWRFLDSIPGPYFSSLAAAGLATLEELAEASAAKRTRANA